MIRRLLFVAACLFIVVFVLSGCATSSAVPTAAPTAAATTAPTAAPNAAPTVAAPKAAPTVGTTTGGTAKPMPKDHAGRTQCLVCHLQGVSGAPKVPSQPDHTAFPDDPAVCLSCHKQSP